MKVRRPPVTGCWSTSSQTRVGAAREPWLSSVPLSSKSDLSVVTHTDPAHLCRQRLGAEEIQQEKNRARTRQRVGKTARAIHSSYQRVQSEYSKIDSAL